MRIFISPLADWTGTVGSPLDVQPAHAASLAACRRLVEARRRVLALARDGAMVQRMGKYEVIERIGRGGMGTIFKARAPRSRLP
jgi:hypothetical protein